MCDRENFHKEIDINGPLLKSIPCTPVHCSLNSRKKEPDLGSVDVGLDRIGHVLLAPIFILVNL